MGVSQNVTMFYILRMYYVLRSLERNISQNVKHNAKRNNLTQIVIII